MIVKNEAEVIRRAIGDWRTLGDQLIVVDTGSTDGTQAIVEGLGGVVVPFEWEAPGHKGQARNVGVEAAEHEWIVVLDADEVIQDQAALQCVVTGMPDHVHAMNTVFQNYDDSDHCTLKWRQLRIFRKGYYLYKHREHELPWPIRDAFEINSEFIFEHRPPAARAPAKADPMLARLELDVQEHPGDPHPLYFLHRQYLHVGQWQRCIDVGMQYLRLPGGHDRSMAFGNLALACLQLGQPAQARVWLHNGLATQPERRVWWMKLAEFYYNAGQPGPALAYLYGAKMTPALPGEQHQEPGINDQSINEFIHLCEHQTGVAHTH